MTRPDEDDVQTPDPLLEAAAGWVARLASPDATKADRAAFARWRDADPTHAAAYAEMDALWRRMGEVPDPRRRRKAPTGKLALAGLCLLGLSLLVQQAGLLDRRADLEAPLGATAQATLADGSRVALNTGAALALRFTAAERAVELLRGEVAFDVVADQARPFRVIGPGLSVRVVGTRFYVRTDGAAEPVGVVEGRVEVEDARGPLALGPGEAARRGPDGGLAVAKGDIARRLAWREGRLIYSGQPLGEVLDDIARYRRGRILLLDRAAREIRVSATLDARDPDAALDALARILGLRLTRLTPFLVLVRRGA